MRRADPSVIARKRVRYTTRAGVEKTYEYETRVFYFTGHGPKKEGLLFRAPVFASRIETAERYWETQIGQVPPWVEWGEIADLHLRERRTVYRRPPWYERVEQGKYLPQKAKPVPKERLLAAVRRAELEAQFPSRKKRKYEAELLRVRKLMGG